jgi:hypothetical protein
MTGGAGARRGAGAVTSVNTVYVIEIMSSLNGGVNALCRGRVEPDLRYYIRDACIAAVNGLMARALHDATQQLDLRCAHADSGLAYVKAPQKVTVRPHFPR